jgi:hypothetical protein
MLSKHTHRPLTGAYKATTGTVSNRDGDRAYNDTLRELERSHGGREHAADRSDRADAVSRAEAQAAASFYR